MDLINNFLCFIFEWFGLAEPGGDHVIFSQVLLPDNNSVIGDINKMELKEGFKSVVKVQPKTRHGHNAAIEPGSAMWESSDESVVQVRPNPTNELEAEIEGIDGSNNESVVVTFRADGKVGEGERPLVGTLDVVCTQGDATVVEMSASAPVDTEGNPDAAPAPAGNGELATNQLPDEKGNQAEPVPTATGDDVSDSDSQTLVSGNVDEVSDEDTQPGENPSKTL